MRNRTIALVVALLFVAILTGWYIRFRPSNPIHWSKGYSSYTKNPYDLWLTHELFGELLGQDTLYTIHQSLDSLLPTIEDPANSSYLCLGRQTYYSVSDRWALTDFMSGGGTLFLAMENWNFIYDLLQDDEGNWLVGLKSLPDTARRWPLILPRRDSTNVLDTLYFEPKNLDTTDLFRSTFLISDSISGVTDTLAWTVDASGQKYPVMIQIEYGNGKIILEHSPLYFTNFFMRETEGKIHLEYLASRLPEGPVYWDEHSKLPMVASTPKAKSYLDYIMKHLALRWAWYLLLIGSLIYVITQVRRQIRSMPVHKNVENTSIQYAQTLGDLYHSTNDHLTWIKIRTELFWQHLRHTLNIHLSPNSVKFTREVALRSGIPQSEIDLVKDIYLAYLQRPRLSTRQVIDYEEKLQRIMQRINKNRTGN